MNVASNIAAYAQFDLVNTEIKQSITNLQRNLHTLRTRINTINSDTKIPGDFCTSVSKKLQWWTKSIGRSFYIYGVKLLLNYTNSQLHGRGRIWPSKKIKACANFQQKFLSHTSCWRISQMALSATFWKTFKQNMFKLMSYIQVKSLVADTLFTCINEYTINKYCIKCVSY